MDPALGGQDTADATGVLLALGAAASSNVGPGARELHVGAPTVAYEGRRTKRLRLAAQQEAQVTPDRAAAPREPRLLSATKSSWKPAATPAPDSRLATPSRSDCEVHECWERLETLWKGSLSEVWLARHRQSGTQQVLKRIDRSVFTKSRRHRSSQISLWSEISLLASLDHPGIVHMYESFQTDSHVCLVMEYVPGGDLFHCIRAGGPFLERQARRLFGEVCQAVAYLHRRGVVHRDLKTENVLLTSPDRDSMRWKLADFGISRTSGTSHDCQTYCGTRGYSAPEIIRLSLDVLVTVLAPERSQEMRPSVDARAAQGGRRLYGRPVDLWSLGVLLYIVLSGVPPFDIHERKNYLYRQILDGNYDFDLDEWSGVSSQAKDLVSGLMTVDPAARLDTSQALGHGWLLGAHDGLRPGSSG